MVVLSAEQWIEINRNIVEEFRANDGRCGGALAGNPMLLLTTTGARTGEARITPLTYHADGADFIVMASAGGSPVHPAWYRNLAADDDVVVEVGKERFSARATTEVGSARVEVFDRMVEELPRFADYQRDVEREVPVVRIQRLAAS
jgi:deazaflavin-dependent oxidoreductase (nitroreductase family)